MSWWGRVRLDEEEQPEASQWPVELPTLSYFERMALFAVTLIGSFVCYGLCLILLPLLSLKPRKFAVLWSLGSILFLTSFAFMNGLSKFTAHLISKERLWFTISFIGSIVATLWFCLVWKYTLVVIICGAIQLIASIAYTVSYFPYGRQGLSLTGTAARAQLDSWINS
ncbi:hypothetical protein OGAPHI_006218 [Ogataea philodendri]|uniref:Protein transport protein SFT2 n=1 Tax=Ogataea philodendri TaxID=1378263 RepID=A0A9P8NZF1_9ASCO|nr:uncharacterized protein OGAPHI_006218 [Ogataea philodendri]KAH3662037.1 hypothetical protein OGAPHI_006218 [Ogataea philodendri]